MKKDYEVAANALFGKSEEKRLVKENETLSLKAHKAETLAIIGESDRGKSTVAKVLVGLETATDEQILLECQNMKSTSIENRATEMVADMQMVFQNPFDTLNPTMTIGRQMIRALKIFKYDNS